jgi:hypothetical protein
MEKLWAEYGMFIVVGTLLITAAAVFTADNYNWGWLNIIPGHRGRMMKKARWDYVLGKASDKFTSDIMEWLQEEELNQAEAAELYRLLKQALPNKNLFPSEVLLKAAIQKRITAGIHTPVELPKVKVTRKSLFEKPAV